MQQPQQQLLTRRRYTVFCIHCTFSGEGAKSTKLRARRIYVAIIAVPALYIMFCTSSVLLAFSSQFLFCAALIFESSSTIFANGFISGASINAAKNLILHPIETVKTRLDVGESAGLFRDLYAGIVPGLVGGVPAAALFFGTKDLCRQTLRNIGLSPSVSTLLAVMLAQFPYWLIRNPSEVLKTRRRTTGSATITLPLTANQIKDLYSGLTNNLLYALPSDWLKFLFYEFFSTQLFHVEEGAVISAQIAITCGALAALVAETICTPLDVARNRIMAIDDASRQAKVSILSSEFPFLHLTRFCEEESSGGPAEAVEERKSRIDLCW